jgi:predicted RNase H-like nuclease (RuvC/YqgF family)
MYPPHVTDEAIRTLINELAVGDRLPSGALLRAVLKQRFGSPGGVTRVYRLLSNARPKYSAVRKVEAADVLERELQVMRERAERAEQREEAHQSRWAVEVDQLRLEVKAFKNQEQQARQALDSVGLLRRQLQAAEARIAMLERQLIEVNGRGGEKRGV